MIRECHFKLTVLHLQEENLAYPVLGVILNEVEMPTFWMYSLHEHERQPQGNFLCFFVRVSTLQPIMNLKSLKHL